MTTVQGTYQLCGSSWVLDFSCTGPQCGVFTNFPEVNCVTTAGILTCTSIPPPCVGRVHYSSTFEYSQPIGSTIVWTEDSIYLRDLCEKIIFINKSTAASTKFEISEYIPGCHPHYSGPPSCSKPHSCSTTKTSTSTSCKTSTTTSSCKHSSTSTSSRCKTSTTSSSCKHTTTSTSSHCKTSTTSSSCKTPSTTSTCSGSSRSHSRHPTKPHSTTTKCPSSTKHSTTTTKCPSSTKHTTSCHHCTSSTKHTTRCHHCTSSTKHTTKCPSSTTSSTSTKCPTSTKHWPTKHWPLADPIDPVYPQDNNPQDSGEMAAGAGAAGDRTPLSQEPSRVFESSAGRASLPSLNMFWGVLFLVFGFLAQGNAAAAAEPPTDAADAGEDLRHYRPVHDDAVALANKLARQYNMQVPGGAKPTLGDTLVRVLLDIGCDLHINKGCRSPIIKDIDRSRAFAVEFTTNCRTAILDLAISTAPEIIANPGGALLLSLDAGLLCNFMLGSFFQIPHLVSDVCRYPKPCTDDFATDPKNCGRCGNVCSIGVCKSSSCTSDCKGETCKTYKPCGASGSCSCASIAGGTSLCSDDPTPCTELKECRGNQDCPAGRMCALDTCCTDKEGKYKNVCIAASNTCARVDIAAELFLTAPRPGGGGGGFAG